MSYLILYLPWKRKVCQFYIWHGECTTVFQTFHDSYQGQSVIFFGLINYPRKLMAVLPCLYTLQECKISEQ